MKILVIFHARRNGWKNFRKHKPIFGVLHKMKISLPLFLGKISENPSTCRIFPKLQRRKKLVIFHSRRNGWKDFQKSQPIFRSASQNEKISAIAPRKNFWKSFDAPNFLGASDNEKVGNFLLPRDGGKKFGSYLSKMEREDSRYNIGFTGRWIATKQTISIPLR